MAELGPVSQAILDYVNYAAGYIEFFRLINRVRQLTGASHTNNWFFRRLVALALEGHIEAKVLRRHDLVIIKFRRLQEPD